MVSACHAQAPHRRSKREYNHRLRKEETTMTELNLEPLYDWGVTISVDSRYQEDDSTT